jgi:hypothetical protein
MDAERKRIALRREIKELREHIIELEKLYIDLAKEHYVRPLIESLVEDRRDLNLLETELINLGPSDKKIQ